MTVTVSVVVPVYSGELFVESLCAEIADLRQTWRTQCPDLVLEEAIFVDDGSSDGSAEVLEKLGGQYPWVRVITLSRNFGQHPATMAGILHASGDWIATLDEDLQHRPAVIETLLLRAADSHRDVVYAEPTGNVHGAWHRDLLGRAYKRLLARLAGDPVIARFNSFRVCRGPVARAAASVSGHETYFDVALTWFTDRFGFEPVEMTDPRFRTSGGSGYSLKKLLSHARRLLLSTHTKVIRTAALVGMFAVALSLFEAVRALYLRSTDEVTGSVRGWTSLFVAILFFGGVTVFMLVVLSEYLLNIVLHTQGKPTFFPVDRSRDAELQQLLELRRAEPRVS